METVSLESFTNSAQVLFFEYLPNFAISLGILFVGLWLVSVITKTAKKIMLRRDVEITLSTFIGNLIFWTLRILLIITVISKLGIPTTSFVAILGAAGLAIGLSLQGSLSNFAGGILIILMKPFRLGDFIEAQGVLGSVKEIRIFSTVITSPENKVIVIPNASLSNGVIINYSANGTRRVDMVISVGYDADLQLVKTTLNNIIKSIPEVLAEPQPIIYINDLGSSSIEFIVRPYTKNEHILKVRSDVFEKCKAEFNKLGMDIPYPIQIEIQKEG
ncbi:mechanosensitive ion channel family protein [Flavobacterium ardleyense]|uniref:Mechanosensitive ion channel family protein n=1 Tax=Flavobacterium ardleyense TaxID=2038737 RepID=A0ABW5Z966_9FLAO